LTLRLTGNWTAAGLGNLPERLVDIAGKSAVSGLDLSDLGRIDTSGAFLLSSLSAVSPDLVSEAAKTVKRDDLLHLSQLVGPAEPTIQAAPRKPLVQPGWLVHVGKWVEGFWWDVYANLAFYGELLVATGRLIRHPHRMRRPATVTQIERAGLDAIPIIAAANFFVGATIAFLGANLLAQFGASVFAVELVGVSVLREFAVLITAIILAGRSASSFAAEIGAMKMSQEIDAMQVMGVDPIDGLVLPRFVAMLLMTPLLTLIGMAAGLAGGLMVLWPVLDLSPQFFLTRIVEHVGLRHFWIGMSKAPVMAIVVAAIGCRHGFATGGDVDQLGRHVTAAVVQSLFAIIAIDALFALMFLELSL
jgi:phospholipid/cholesterol/gamma-HCH transport system permease protein